MCQHKLNLLDDDGDQEISDDGEIPVYEPGADSDDEMGDGSRADDGEDDGDPSDEEADLNAQDAKASASSKPNGANSTWKAPTTEELANIKAASELFKSNAFKLKVCIPSLVILPVRSVVSLPIENDHILYCGTDRSPAPPSTSQGDSKTNNRIVPTSFT